MDYARRANYERGENRQFVKELIDVMIDGSWTWQLSGSGTRISKGNENLTSEKHRARR